MVPGSQGQAGAGHTGVRASLTHLRPLLPGTCLRPTFPPCPSRAPRTIFTSVASLGPDVNSVIPLRGASESGPRFRTCRGGWASWSPGACQRNSDLEMTSLKMSSAEDNPGFWDPTPDELAQFPSYIVPVRSRRQAPSPLGLHPSSLTALVRTPTSGPGTLLLSLPKPAPSRAPSPLWGRGVDGCGAPTLDLG